MKKIWIKTKSFSLQCKRVWQILKKPSKREFLLIAKVSAIGILIIGFVGFILSIILRIALK